MSSTKRGGTIEEIDKDNWETPKWTVRRLAEEIWLPGGEWLEPCAGNGRIIEAINEDRGDVKWTAVEKRRECEKELQKQRTRISCPADFLVWDARKAQKADHPRHYFDVGFTNPPFSITMEILSKMLTICEWVVILQRLNWIGSGVNNGKNDFLRKTPPDIYPLPDRVKFLQNGEFPRHPPGTKDRSGKDIGGQLMSGDSIEYAWYVWGPKEERIRDKGSFKNLLPTSLEERLAG